MTGSNVLCRWQLVASAGGVLIWAIVCAFAFCVIYRTDSIEMRVKQTAKTSDAAYIQAIIIIDPSQEVQVAFLGGKAKGITDVDFGSLGLDKSFPRQVRFNLAGFGLSFKFHTLVQLKQAAENCPWGFEALFEVKLGETV